MINDRSLFFFEKKYKMDHLGITVKRVTSLISNYVNICKREIILKFLMQDE